jgi:hypothetical protein
LTNDDEEDDDDEEDNDQDVSVFVSFIESIPYIVRLKNEQYYDLTIELLSIIVGYYEILSRVDKSR